MALVPQEAQAPLDSDPLRDCPISLIPVPRLTLAARDQWAERIGAGLAAWLSGYPVHKNFFAQPPRMHHRPASREENMSVLERAWSDREFSRFLEIGCIMESPHRPWRLHPWHLVPKKGPKLFRLVINMISTNRYLRYVAGRYEDIRTVLSMIKRNFWFMTRDMTDAYFMVHVHKDSREYLGFVWRDKFYVWRTLLFGLSDSAGVFTSIISALVDYWRLQGLSISSFFDDLFWTHRLKSMCEAWQDFISKEAGILGITLDPKKGNTAPTQRGVVLGFLIDTCDMMVSIPPEALSRIKEKAVAMIRVGYSSMRKIYSLASSLMTYRRASMMAAPHAYALYVACRGHTSWDRTFKISEELMMELIWIRDSLALHATRRFGWLPEETVHLRSDASATGCCLVQVDPVSKLPIGPEMRSAFTPEEIVLSSNNRELRTLQRGLECFATLLRGKVCQIEQDNSCSAVYATKGGGPVIELLAISRQIWETAVKIGTDLLPTQHIPRALNEVADFGSRNFEKEDYGLCAEKFLKLSKKWGPFSCDRFADDFNTRLPVFNSRWLCPAAAATDCFSQRWDGREYLFPPISMLAAVVDKIRNERAKGLLIAPYNKQLAPLLEGIGIRDIEDLPLVYLRAGISKTPLPATALSAPFRWVAIRFNAGRRSSGR